jgi:hypothetical protein
MDVRGVNQAPLLVQARIVQQGVLIYERDRARRVAVEVMTRKLYFDFAPEARRLRDAFVERAHKEGLIRNQASSSPPRIPSCRHLQRRPPQ